MSWQDEAEPWGGPSSLTPVQVAAVVVQNFPDGVTDDGESIRQVALAVAWSESGLDPKAGGDRNYPIWSLGLWQIQGSQHPQYNPDLLLDPEYNARAAIDISGGGKTWGGNRWSVYTGGSYKSHMDAAAVALSQVTGISIPAHVPVSKPINPSNFMQYFDKAVVGEQMRNRNILLAGIFAAVFIGGITIVASD